MGKRGSWFRARGPGPSGPVPCISFWPVYLPPGLGLLLSGSGFFLCSPVWVLPLCRVFRSCPLWGKGKPKQLQYMAQLIENIMCSVVKKVGTQNKSSLMKAGAQVQIQGRGPVTPQANTIAKSRTGVSARARMGSGAQGPGPDQQAEIRMRTRRLAKKLKTRACVWLCCLIVGNRDILVG